MIDLNWYHSFVAIYRTGSVSKAANARFLTQPAVSQHLAGLEAAVGQPLFHRLPRQMVPTERGKELYNQIVQAIDTLTYTEQTLRMVSVERPSIRIGAPVEYFAEVALERLAALPHRFSVRFGLPQELIPALEQGHVDVVIATQRRPGMAVDYRKLADEHFILVGAGHEQHVPKMSDRGLSGPGIEQWLLDQPWISYGSELPIIRRFWQQIFEHRPSMQPTLIIPDLRVILKAVENGYGISILPEYLCRAGVAAGRIRVLWQPSQPVVNELWLATRRVDRAKPELQPVYDVLQADRRVV